MTGPWTNTGHGHVWPRPDGVKARCGGPPICRECARDAAQYLGIDRFEKQQEKAARERPPTGYEDLSDVQLIKEFKTGQEVIRHVQGAMDRIRREIKRRARNGR